MSRDDQTGNEPLTEGVLVELRRLTSQVEHATPWQVSVEWAPDVPLPDKRQSPLVETSVHQAGSDVVLAADGQPVADVAGAGDAILIAAAVNVLPQLLGELILLRERDRVSARRIARLQELNARAAQLLHEHGIEWEPVKGTWRVLRQDDHGGTTFVVRRGLTREEAIAEKERLEGGLAHKQIYWVETDDD